MLDEYAAAEDGVEDDDIIPFAVRHVQVSFGGMIAEELFFGAVDDRTCDGDARAISIFAERICPPDAQEMTEMCIEASEGASEDELPGVATAKLAELPLNEQDYFTQWLEHRTRKLLRNRKHLIEALAQQLLATKQVTAQEVKNIVAEATRKAFAQPCARMQGGRP